ncbi:restriction endonuclease subunit S [Pirellulaceae bacterium SH501]
MQSNWTTKTLGDCCDFLSGGTPRKAVAEYWTGTIPWISGKDLKSFYLSDAEDHITAEGAEAGSRIVPAGTILLLVRGMTLHNSVPVAVLTREAAFNQDIKAIRAKEHVDQQFLSHWLVAARPKLLATVHAAGHGTGVLATDRLKALELDLPPLAEQRRIAEVFCQLEDKIEQNRRTGAKLEGLARAVFKAWFVDFEPVKAKAAGATAFPGMPPETFATLPTRFQDTTLGPVPEGWAVKPLSDAFEVNPPRRLSKGDDAPYLDMKNMPIDGHAPDTWERRPHGSGMKFVNGDTLVARITPCLENGKTAYVDFLNDGEVGWGSTEYIVLRPKPPLPQIHAYCLARTPEFRDFAIQNMTGTSGRQRVSASALDHYHIAIPDLVTATGFGEVVRPLFACIRAGKAESAKLGSLRDYILPRLISGSVRIKSEGIV